MTPMESRDSTTPNRVRFFTANTLVEHIAKEKWDLVKVSCAQPFNQHVKFGLAFVTLHTPSQPKGDDSPEKPKELVPKSADKTLAFGKFRLRSDSDDDSSPGRSTAAASTSVFDKWKASRHSASSNKNNMKDKIESMKKAETQRRLSNPSGNSSDDEIMKRGMRRNRDALLYDEEDDAPNEKLDKKLKLEQEKRDKEQQEESAKKKTKKSPEKKKESRKSRSRSPSPSRRPKHASPARPSTSSVARRDSTPEPPEKTVSYRPFKKLLDGVVFAIR